MMVVLFYIIPRFVLGTLSLNTLLILFVILGVITGFLISWSAPATNNPIFSELFKPEIRSSAFAIDRLFEGSIAAAGTYLVALIANRIFGYSELSAAKGTLSNILAMSNALLVTTIIPWAVCLFVYTFVYFTYPKDRDTAVQEMKEDYLKSYGETVAFDLYDEEQEEDKAPKDQSGEQQ
jgi:ABC-type transporter Mla maintaining outer membrane lipid asymmetry permease subunit MlaE